MKFKTKFSFLFIGIIIALMGSVLFYFHSYFGAYFEKQAADNFRDIAETSEGAYYSFFNSMQTRTVDWSSDGYIRTTTARLIALPEGEERTALRNQLTDYFVHKKLPYDPTISIIDILDRDGIIVASSQENRLGLNEKEEEEEFQAHRFSEAITSLSPTAFLTNLVFEEDEGMDPMIHVVSRLFIQDEKTKKTTPLDAVMLLHFTNTNDLGNLLNGSLQLGEGAPSGRALFEHYKTAEVYVVNKDRLLITPSRFVSDAILKLHIDTDPIKKCFDENREISGTYLNYRNIPVIGASMCLHRDNAILIVEAERDEIMMPLKQFEFRFFISSIIAIIVGALGTLLLNSMLLRNFESIGEAAKKITEHDLTARATISSHDEIGKIAETFNAMISSIEKSETELKKAQMELKGVNITLEKRVKERTAELEKIKETLEKAATERTVELQKKIEELEKFKRLTVGRELKMVELKNEIGKLDQKH